MNLRHFYAAVLIVVILLSIGAGPVAGKVYPVDNSISLPAFQNFLNTTSDGDTITFASGTYYYYNVLVLTNNLTFQSNQSIGATTQNTILDGIDGPGLGANGILYNTSSTGAQITNITVRDLTFRNGYSSSSDGGGAIHTYANTTVISSDFTNDTAPGKNGGGAVSVHSYGLLLTVTGSNFTSCSALEGGALFMNTVGIIAVNSSSFVNCYGTTNGGAVYASNQVNATFCRFGSTSSGTGDILHTNGGDIYAPDNWWGTNFPTASMAAGGTFYQYPYLVLGITATPAGITTALASTIQANLSYDSTGTPAAGNILPDGIPVIFTIGSGPAGSAVSAAQVLTANHLAGTTFSSPAAGIAKVNASVDGFNVSVNVSVTAAASPDTGNGGSRTDYWVKTGTNDVGYEGTQPTLLGFSPSPTQTIPATPVETPAVTPSAIPPHPVPTPVPTIPDRITALIQEYLVWLILIVIIIILVALLRRW